MKNIQVHVFSLTKHNCRSLLSESSSERMFSRSPLWLVAPVTSLSPPSLCFYGPPLPVSLASSAGSSCLGCRPHSRIPWLEALMLLLLQLFQALWCHLKEGPALMPRAWVTTREGERERERFSEEEHLNIRGMLFVPILSHETLKPSWWKNQRTHIGVTGLMQLNKTVSKRSVVAFFCLLLLLYFKMNQFFWILSILRIFFCWILFLEILYFMVI